MTSPGPISTLIAKTLCWTGLAISITQMAVGASILYRERGKSNRGRE